MKTEEKIITDNKRYLDGIAKILDLWQSSDNKSKFGMQSSIALYTAFAFNGQEYIFKEIDSCNHKSDKVNLKGIGHFCSECGCIYPF